MIRTTRRLVRLVIALALLVVCGCASVQPWDRDLLAQKRMSFNPAPMIQAVDDHIYFSKEGSMGGIDVAGGGCGCN
jgi:hypothetical protein